MTTWTEAQIDRHLHLWEHRHGPDSPEAGIVRQLRAERDAMRDALAVYADPQSWASNPRDQGVRTSQMDYDKGHRARAALPTTQETPHD